MRQEGEHEEEREERVAADMYHVLRTFKVILADDHELVREGIRRLLEDSGQVEVVAEAACGEEVVELARQHAPDAVLLDVNMPGIGGLEATRRLHALMPGIRIVVISVYGEGPLPGRMLEAGASAYLTKGCTTETILDALEAVDRGERYLDADVARHLALNMLPGGACNPFDRLSQREMQVALMMLAGQRVGQIAEDMHLSAKTISTYRHRIFSKLGVGSDSALTRLAMEHGVGEQPPGTAEGAAGS
ncbi:two component transcriptional regulator, LuxR family [Thiohalospira halophila DSM 15071]|uniref:Two component transcriptional regulator, LuxR family n=1 Tax=Thiohalospira halophila DSM 15071 TaxID=1123397 RepID=A0A1I1P611_9GAMM|nr:response regulator [Thiohalospira halophila]SFD02433.1 two component transcriptional regulator, LuxR family [Thiohalospira halophila DSM 15071]